MEKGIEDLNRGAEAYQAGDYETAVAYYKKRRQREASRR